MHQSIEWELRGKKTAASVHTHKHTNAYLCVSRFWIGCLLNGMYVRAVSYHRIVQPVSTMSLEFFCVSVKKISSIPLPPYNSCPFSRGQTNFVVFRVYCERRTQRTSQRCARSCDRVPCRAGAIILLFSR